MKSLIALFLLLTAPAVSFAHGIVVRIDLVGPTVAVTAKFDDDEPADDCIVTVTAEDGTVVVKGPTDKTGLFTFPRPGPGTYTITADAGAGHLAKKTLTVAVEGEAKPAEAEPEAPRRRRNSAVWISLVAVGVCVGSVIIRKRAKAA